MALVTITDNVGSGGREISAQVAEELELTLYDDARLQAVAVKLGVDLPEVGGLDEKAPGLFDRLLTRRPHAYLDFMESVVYAVARKGKGVIIGHGSQMLLRSFDCAFHVRIHSPASRRLRRIMETRGLDKAAADRFMQRLDSRKEGFFRFAFRGDRDDPSLYDLILNTAKIGPRAAADLIVAAVRNPLTAECTLGALDAMDRLSLEKRVQAVLLKNGVDLSYVSVEARDANQVVVSGLVYSESVKDGIPRWIAASAEPPIRVETQLVLMPPGY